MMRFFNICCFGFRAILRCAPKIRVQMMYRMLLRCYVTSFSDWFFSIILSHSSFILAIFIFEHWMSKLHAIAIRLRSIRSKQKRITNARECGPCKRKKNHSHGKQNKWRTKWITATGPFNQHKNQYHAQFTIRKSSHLNDINPWLLVHNELIHYFWWPKRWQQ